jgi:hypothetical protein
MNTSVSTKWFIGVIGVAIFVWVLAYVNIGQLPLPLAQQRGSLVAIPTVAIAGIPAVGSWPNSDNRLDYIADLGDSVFSNTGYSNNAANAHVVTSVQVDAGLPDPAGTIQRGLTRYLQTNPGTPIGRYISGGDCLESGADRVYPPAAVTCEDLTAALGDSPPADVLLPYIGSNPYGGHRFRVNIAIPEVRTAFANLIAAEANRAGLPLLYVDNIMHPSTGGLNGTSITFDHIIQLLSSIRSQIHGAKLVINIALSPADLLDTPAYSSHIAALQNAVDGMSFEAPLHPYYKDKSASIANEITVIRRWLSAGKLILFVNGYNPGELGELKFEAAYSLMIRRPGDAIFTARLYFRPQSDFDWINWSERLGPALGDYEFVTTSPVLMRRTFQNGTLTLDPVARQASIQWNTSTPTPVDNNQPPPPDDNQNQTTTDTTPPTVSITAPSSGAVISGTVPFTAEASDNKRVTRVTFHVGTRQMGSDSTAPYALSSRLNTKSFANGPQELSVKAYDARGNIGTSAITVTIDNTKAPPPAPVIAAPQTKAEVLRRVSAIITQLMAYLTEAKRTGTRIDFPRVDFLIRTIVNLLNQLRVYQGR